MANYLYNGYRYADINEVWTDELKVTHPYAVLEVSSDGTFSSWPLQLFTSIEYTLKDGEEAIVYTEDNHIQYGYYTDGFGVTGWHLRNHHYTTPRVTSRKVWASFDVLSTTGDLLLAASDPIPVGGATPDLDPTSMLQGWLVGRRIAAQRGKVAT